MTQKENALSGFGENPDITEEGEKENIFKLHITIPPLSCQILYGCTAWISLLGLLGSVGGMENDAVGLTQGIIQVAAFLIVWVVSLKQGDWI